MPSTCEFQLNNPNAVYYSGETISGTIILKTTSAKDVKDIRINFCGKGKVHWTETEKRRRSDGSHSNHTVHFESNELYIDNTTSVFGEGTLPAGTHTYAFHIVLPLQCPTSCEGRYGHIRYVLSLKVKRSFRYDNTFSKPLSVIKSLDLNLNPIYRIPTATEEIFKPCCFSCTNGDINATVTIPFGGYAIGQTVRYSLLVKNQFMDDISGYTIEFNRKMEFTARTPHHKTREEVTTLHEETHNTPCLRLSTRLLEGNFVIVSTPPSTEGDVIIKVLYYAKFILHTDGCNSDKKIRVPIFIGTVPLRESMFNGRNNQNDHETDHLVDFQPTAPDLQMDNENGGDLPPSYKDLGPPSFEEATRSSSPFIDKDKDEHNRHIGFRPLYPSYSQSDD